MLHISTVNGYEKILGYLIINKADIEEVYIYNPASLILACKFLMLRIIYLLSKLKEYQCTGNSAFHYACAYGWINILNLLVKKKLQY